MPVYAVTGASGHLGGFAVQQLLARGVPPSAAALLHDEGGNRTYELGGPAFGLPRLAQVISEVTGAQVTYRDLPAEEYADALQRAGLYEATARFVASIDSSIARGELETRSGDLANLLGRAATRPADVVHMALTS
jgi:NAD(P)H dehydrogenase (quinone)